MRWWIALILIVGLIYAYSGGQGQQESDGSGRSSPPPERLEINLQTSCEGAVITVSAAQKPVEGADVFIRDARTNKEIFRGKTDQEGRVLLEGCGQAIIINTNKEGYLSNQIKGELIDCEQCNPPCETDKECPQGYYCAQQDGEPFLLTHTPQQQGTCEPLPQCEEDSDCPAYYKCQQVVTSKGEQLKACTPQPCNEQWDCVPDRYCEQQPQPQQLNTLTAAFNYEQQGWCNQPPSCKEDRDCEKGAVCEQGICVFPECESDNDCQEGICYQGSCIPQPQCETKEECKEGYTCYQGSCIKKECESHQECAQGICIDGLCVEGCREDSDCEGDSVCDLSQGAGFCREAQYDIECGKKEMKVGEEVECKITREGKPCSRCSVLYTNAAGESKKIESDEEGRIIIVGEQEGVYKIKAGNSQEEITATSPSSEEERAESEAILSQPLLWGIIILIIALGSYLIWRAHR